MEKPTLKPHLLRDIMHNTIKRHLAPDNRHIADCSFYDAVSLALASKPTFNAFHHVVAEEITIIYHCGYTVLIAARDVPLNRSTNTFIIAKLGYGDDKSGCPHIQHHSLFYRFASIAQFIFDEPRVDHSKDLAMLGPMLMKQKSITKVKIDGKAHYANMILERFFTEWPIEKLECDTGIFLKFLHSTCMKLDLLKSLKLINDIDDLLPFFQAARRMPILEELSFFSLSDSLKCVLNDVPRKFTMPSIRKLSFEKRKGIATKEFVAKFPELQKIFPSCTERHAIFRAYHGLNLEDVELTGIIHDDILSKDYGKGKTSFTIQEIDQIYHAGSKAAKDTMKILYKAGFTDSKNPDILVSCVRTRNNNKITHFISRCSPFTVKPK